MEVINMKADLNHILIRPHIAEKASFKAESSVYTFEVDAKAGKNDVRKAFVEKYKIIPLKVNTVTIPAKQVIVRNKRGTKSGYKKAYVYLKKGTKLDTL